MDPIILISGTNRPNSVSSHITQLYHTLLNDRQVPSSIIDLQNLPKDFLFSALYDNEGENESFNKLVDIMRSCKKMVFIVPEYNGSFPGVLKGFLDGMEYPGTFRNKKAALIGLASGGHGASMALSHLTDILHHCGTNVLAFKPRLEKIEKNMEDGVINNPMYLKMLNLQIDLFLEF